MRTVLAATWIIVASIGCSAGKSSASSPQQPPGARPHPLTLTFSTSATSYNGPTDPPPSTTLGDMIVRQVQEAAARVGRPVPVADARLFLAAAALATVTPEEGVVSYPLVEFALHTNGIIESSPHLLVVWGRLYEPRGGGILEALEPSIDQIVRTEDITRIGIGAVVRGQLGYGAVVVALLSSQVRTSPIPRAVAANGAVEFELGLSPRLREPRVTVSLPNGNVDVVRLVMKAADTFTVRIECGGAGRMLVEIGARNGPNAAKFPVWCGMEAPRTLTLAAHVNDVPRDSAEAERKMLELVNQDRNAIGKQPLVWDEDLAKIARYHSGEMRRSGVVASKTPDGMSIKKRVEGKRNDIETDGTVARAYSIAEAHRGLMDLPSTRRTLVSGEAETIGIGIVYGQMIAGGMRELFITEIVAMPKDPWR